MSLLDLQSLESPQTMNGKSSKHGGGHGGGGHIIGGDTSGLSLLLC
ncbi:MAG: Lanthionine-containing peptide SapB precursor RamS [Solirubrobacteraceae bacterium]|jgi:hypothetical protein|nr:Lanthionine-containing peptide SapB precursor RamS [Solirubrobacteraceae bacterium]